MKKHLFLIITIILTVILMLQRFTGMGIHAICGLILLVIGIAHMNMCKSIYQYRTQPVKTIDMLTALSFISVNISGFMLKPFSEVSAVLILHKLSAVVFIISLVLHIYYAYKKAHKK